MSSIATRAYSYVGGLIVHEVDNFSPVFGIYTPGKAVSGRGWKLPYRDLVGWDQRTKGSHHIL